MYSHDVNIREMGSDGSVSRMKKLNVSRTECPPERGAHS
jgi:hypothetical protein